MSYSGWTVKPVLFFTLLFVVLPSLAFETPSGVNMFPAYPAVINPALDDIPDTSHPIGVGSAAEGGDNVSFKVELEAPGNTTDLYFAIFAPQISPSTFFFMSEKNELESLNGLNQPWPVWKQAVSETIDENLLGDIPVSSIPEGDYSIYLLQTAAGTNPLENYYLWNTTLKHRKGILFDTGNPSAPYIYTHKSQASVQFNANPETGGLVGTTIISPQGQILNIEIDESTGLPTHLVVEGTIFQIGNIRQDEGLADVTIIDSDGEIEYLYDIDYEAAAKKSSINKRTDNSLLQNRGALNVSGKIYDGSNVAYYIVSCVAGPVTLLAKVAKVPDFIFDSSSVVGGCVSSMDFLLGHVDSKTEALSTDSSDAVEITAELTSLGINTVGAAGSCFVAATTALTPAIALTGLNCLYQLSEIAQFSGSKTIERLIASYELAMDRQRGIVEDNKKNFKAFCCDGPTRIEVGEEGLWLAMVNVGIKPYRFAFKWGDGPGDIIRNVDKIMQFAEHTYDEVGTYTIEVEVNDSAYNFDDSDKFTVEVVDKIEALAINCCNGDAQVEKDTTNTWQPTISGGVTPYEVNFDWGDNSKNTYIVANTKSAIIPQHNYKEDGDYQIIATVTDFMGSYSDDVSYIVHVDTDPTPEFELDFSEINRVDIKAFFGFKTTVIDYDTEYDISGRAFGTGTRECFEGTVTQLTNNFSCVHTSSTGVVTNNYKFSFNINGKGDQITAFDFSSDRQWNNSNEHHNIILEGSGILDLSDIFSPSNYTYELKGQAACDIITFEHKEYREETAGSGDTFLKEHHHSPTCDKRSYIKISFLKATL